tara:strand:+ start:347 stop:514 length:168 start_codon:yes stop_codon:yes gene_type:complete
MDYIQEGTLTFIFLIYIYFFYKVLRELNKDRKKDINQNMMEDEEQIEKLIKKETV